MKEKDGIYVFNGGSSFPSGVFSNFNTAKEHIAKHSLTGVLTNYPIDVFVYDWAIDQGFFTPKRDNQKEAHFIGNFSSASQEHWHFKNGNVFD